MCIYVIQNANVCTEEGVRSPGTEVIGSYGLPNVSSRELNQGPLQRQRMLLTSLALKTTV